MSNHADIDYLQGVDTELLGDSTADAVTTADQKTRDMGIASDRRDSEINNDPTLSQAGRALRIGESHNMFAQRLQSEIEPLVDKITRDVDTLERRRQPPAPSGDAVTRELRAQEIRAFIRQMDPVFRPAALLDRAKIGDVDFIAAVADSPTDEICDPVALAAAREQLKVTTYPAISRQLAETARALAITRLMIADLKRKFGIGVDPIAELARGTPATAATTNGGTAFTFNNDLAHDSGVRRLAGFGDDPE